MKHFYCTLFDSFYLYRGLLMYESLAQHDQNFHIYIFAFDKLSLETLIQLDLKNATIISLDEFEDDELLAVKASRTPVEYCWTTTPSTILYCIEKFKLTHCTYLDADLFFYNSPSPIFEEIKDKSVLITPHDFSKKYQKYAVNGVFNVQFMYFRNDAEGMQVLRHWRNQCLDWCYSKIEDGKFGDQKYLDDWPGLYKCVHVLEDNFLTLAPWNIQQYQLEVQNDSIQVNDLGGSNLGMAVFYHFHGMSLYKNGYSILSGYEISKDVVDNIYVVYINKLMSLRKAVEERTHFGIGNGFLDDKIKGLELKVLERRMLKNKNSNTSILIFDRISYEKVRNQTSPFQYIKVISRSLKHRILSLLPR